MKNQIRIQKMGMRDAKPAKEFQIGEMIQWNGGAYSVIKSIHKETPKQIQFITDEFAYNGELTRANIINRRLGKDRLVAIKK